MRFLNDDQRKAVFARMGKNQFTLIGRPGTWVSRGAHERAKAAEAVKEAAKTLSDYFPKVEHSVGWSEARKKAWAAKKAMQAGDYGAAGFSRVTTTRKGEPDKVIRQWVKGKGWAKAGIFAPLGSAESTAPYFTPEALDAWRLGKIASPVHKVAPASKMWQQIWDEKNKNLGIGQLRQLIRKGNLPGEATIDMFRRIGGITPDDLGLTPKELKKFTDELGNRSLTDYLHDVTDTTPQQISEMVVHRQYNIPMLEGALLGGRQDTATEAALRRTLEGAVSALAPKGEYTPEQQAMLSAMTVEIVEKEGRLPNEYEIEAAIQRMEGESSVRKNIIKRLEAEGQVTLGPEARKAALQRYDITGTMPTLEQALAGPRPEQMDMEQFFGAFKGMGIQPEGALGMIGAPMGVDLLLQQKAAAEELALGRRIDMPVQWRPGVDWMKGMIESGKPTGSIPFLRGGPGSWLSDFGASQPSSGYGGYTSYDLGAQVPQGGIPTSIPEESSLSPFLLPAVAGAGGLLIAGTIGKSRHVKRKPKEEEEKKR